jgi:hypothetical protein
VSGGPGDAVGSAGLGSTSLPVLDDLLRRGIEFVTRPAGIGGRREPELMSFGRRHRDGPRTPARQVLHRNARHPRPRRLAQPAIDCARAQPGRVALGHGPDIREGQPGAEKHECSHRNQHIADWVVAGRQPASEQPDRHHQKDHAGDPLYTLLMATELEYQDIPLDHAAMILRRTGQAQEPAVCP